MSCAADGGGTLALVPMTRALCRRYYREFENDPAVFADGAARPFCYSDGWADAYFDRQREKGRLHTAVMEDGAPVGEILFKSIDRAAGCCALGVHLQNDRAKGRGIGTRAERLALAYAFCELGLERVQADALRGNARSRHVMEKVGFRFLREEGDFAYYEITRAEFLRGEGADEK